MVDSSCWRAASAPIVALNDVTKSSRRFGSEASAPNVCAVPVTTPDRSWGCWPNSAALTIAEALNAPAAYCSDWLSASPAVSPRTLGSWVASCAAVGRPLSERPKPCRSVCRSARVLERSADSTRSSWTGPVVCEAGSVCPDRTIGAAGVPGCRST